MTDWQKGDVALCVNDRALSHGEIHRGKFYTVDGVRTGTLADGGGQTTVLDLREVPSIVGYCAFRFVKVTPEEPDAEDLMVIAQLSGGLERSPPLPVGEGC